MLEGFRYLPAALDRPGQEALLAELRQVIAAAPFYWPVMPRSGRPFSVLMTNAGAWGWLSDKAGYRYSERHPETGQPWPAIPPGLLDLWDRLTGFPAPPDCCLCNYYADAKARMGLHQDRDEDSFAPPVLSLSLGDRAVFRIGGLTRRGPTRSLKLDSGDVVLLSGDARLAFHGIDRVLAGSSRLLPEGGRLNVTLRRVRDF